MIFSSGHDGLKASVEIAGVRRVELHAVLRIGPHGAGVATILSQQSRQAGRKRVRYDFFNC